MPLGGVATLRESELRDAAVAVGREHGIPVWLHCLPRYLMRRWAEHLSGRDPHSPYLALGELGTPDDAISMRIETRGHYDRRLQAIAVHRSQVSPYEALPEDLRRAFLTTEHLCVAFDPERALGDDPDWTRHHHDRPGCYWNYVDCCWSCNHAPAAATARS